jgi:hypothetical protein
VGSIIALFISIMLNDGSKTPRTNGITDVFGSLFFVGGVLGLVYNVSLATWLLLNVFI